MKALLVADNDTAIENISTVLKAAGYDTIVYRWLLKALDNIEEIAPHLIIISTKDYPRHWKTMTQFVQSGIGGHIPQVILYVPEDFSEEEEKKAEALGVRGLFDSVGVEGLDKLRDILTKQDDIYSGTLNDTENITKEADTDSDGLQETGNLSEESLAEEPPAEEPPAEEPPAEEPPAEEPPAVSTVDEENDSEELSIWKESPDVQKDAVSERENEENIETLCSEEETKDSDHTEKINNKPVEIACSFMFTNPLSGALVTGMSRNYNGTSLSFIPDIQSSARGIAEGTKITEASIKTDEIIESVNAEVCKLEDKTLIISLGHC